MTDSLFYLLDIVVLGIVIKLILNSMKIKVHSDVGSNKIATILFVAFAAFLYFTGNSVFNTIQSVVVLMIGLAYLNIRSGFVDDGIVLMGKLYKGQFIRNLELEKDGEAYRVSFKYKKKQHFLYLTESNAKQAKEIMQNLQRRG